MPDFTACPEVVCETTPHGLGLITLQRPQALNALSLPMIRALTAALLAWRDDPAIRAVAVRGQHRDGPFGAFCAGGDIRYFHEAAHAGDPSLEDYFNEEYALDHLIFRYPKPYIAFMDGIVMGGGMGISQGASVRIVTERTRMAMPETQIGLFPDVGGGYFLSRSPGHAGEYLGLTGHVIGGQDAMGYGLADVLAPARELPLGWEALQRIEAGDPPAFLRAWQDWMQTAGWRSVSATGPSPLDPALEFAFAQDSVPAIVAVLQADPGEASTQALALLRTRSPLMLHVVLEQIRRARSLSFAENLRLERDLMRHCFHTAHLQRTGRHTETVEGIRALAIDKDRQPRWSPARIEDVRPEMVQPFFESPWPSWAHPLRHLD
jgi:enoyl-CoA hydratase/carnithine racemase